MTEEREQVTVTSLAGEAARVLEGAGFKVAQQSTTWKWKATAAKVYEDSYSVVCVAVYETWAELSSGWTEDQATLVGLISAHFARSEAKAWDGYLVLFTPSVVPVAEHLTAVGIRRNTLHVRKLFAAGDELWSLASVRRTLLPLLPLDNHETLEARNVLDALPPLLAEHGIDEEAARVAIEAFRGQRPILGDIHGYLTTRREEQS